MGFTALSEALEPRELIPFLNAYSGALVAAVHGEGGDVLKFMGDGLLAIFPVEGDPAAACRAALRGGSWCRRCGRSPLHPPCPASSRRCRGCHIREGKWGRSDASLTAPRLMSAAGGRLHGLNVLHRFWFIFG